MNYYFYNLVSLKENPIEFVEILYTESFLDYNHQICNTNCNNMFLKGKKKLNFLKFNVNHVKIN